MVACFTCTRIPNCREITSNCMTGKFWMVEGKFGLETSERLVTHKTSGAFSGISPGKPLIEVSQCPEIEGGSIAPCQTSLFSNNSGRVFQRLTGCRKRNH